MRGAGGRDGSQSVGGREVKTVWTIMALATVAAGVALAVAGGLEWGFRDGVPCGFFAWWLVGGIECLAFAIWHRWLDT